MPFVSNRLLLRIIHSACLHNCDIILNAIRQSRTVGSYPVLAHRWILIPKIAVLVLISCWILLLLTQIDRINWMATLPDSLSGDWHILLALQSWLCFPRSLFLHRCGLVAGRLSGFAKVTELVNSGDGMWVQVYSDSKGHRLPTTVSQLSGDTMTSYVTYLELGVQHLSPTAKRRTWVLSYWLHNGQVIQLSMHTSRSEKWPWSGQHKRL